MQNVNGVNGAKQYLNKSDEICSYIREHQGEDGVPGELLHEVFKHFIPKKQLESKTAGLCYPKKIISGAIKNGSILIIMNGDEERFFEAETYQPKKKNPFYLEGVDEVRSGSHREKVGEVKHRPHIRRSRKFLRQQQDKEVKQEVKQTLQPVMQAEQLVEAVVNHVPEMRGRIKLKMILEIDGEDYLLTPEEASEFKKELSSKLP